MNIDISQIKRLEESDFDHWIIARNKLWPTDDHDLLKEHEIEAKELLADDRSYAWGIYSDGVLVAFLEAFIRPFANGCVTRPVPFMEGIWVDERVRGKGYAHSLLSFVEAFFSELGFTEMGSDVELENILSQKAHNRWGFEEKERVVYYKKNLSK